MISVVLRSDVEIPLIDKLFFPQPWTEEQWNQAFLNKNYRIFSLLKNEKLTGFALFQVDVEDQFSHLLKVLVLPNESNKGYGALLLKNALLFLSNECINRLYLEVAVSNFYAISCYKQLGFEILTLKRRFYSNGDDAYAMQLLL